jgi:hypothetical protein
LTGAVDGQQRLVFYVLTCFYLLFFICFAPPSFVPHPLNLHNRLMDNSGAGKEEVLLEAAVEMETESEELKDFLVGIVCKKKLRNRASA